MRNIFVYILIIFSPALSAQVISTYVGGGSGLGDGGPATAANINTPWQGTFDKYGNFYFAEGGGNRIRKVNTAGIITTIAGTGIPGYNGEGIQATNAKLQNPEAVAIDAAGDIYIADGGNNRVRKINVLTGIITTVAGTGSGGYDGDNVAASTAKIYAPRDICFDKSGNLFIADYANYRVRKVDVSGVITTYAGKGTSASTGDGGAATAAEFELISGITIDNAGNLYIADWNGGKVRKVNTGGIITTFAGTGTLTYNGDNILATTANIGPVRIAMSSVNELYIADNANNRIRKIDAIGTIHTVVGNGGSGFTGDGGMATSAEIGNPGGVMLDPCDNIFISQVHSSRIRLVTVVPSCNPALSNSIVSPLTLSIYPNPASNFINIDNVQSKAVYKLINMLGIKQQQGTLKTGNNSISIELQPVGIYLLEISNSEGQRTITKIVKQ